MGARTVTIEDDQRDNHQKGMPIELNGWGVLPGESITKVKDPHLTTKKSPHFDFLHLRN